MSVQTHVWTEKYRPTTLDDVVGHPKITNRLKRWVGDPEMPSIMFAGRQGTGKTAMTVALAREMYGDRWKHNILELNASDDRGIDVVRDEIKDFARTDTVGDFPFKIIFLDEVDNTTKDAQSAMRRTMERFSDKTRFILSCNYAGKVIPPIQSRCVVFRVPPLDDSDIRDIIEKVAINESLQFEGEAKEMLVESASGDARKAIGDLQASQLDGEVTEDAVETVAGIIDYQDVREIIAQSVAGELTEAQRKLDVDVLKEGISEHYFLEEAFNVVKSDWDIPDDARAKCIDVIAETDYRLLEGANPHIQLHNVLAQMHIAYHLSLPNYNND